MALLMPITVPDGVQRWPISKLRGYDRNARTHSAEQVAQIVASIQEFGFTNPLLIAGDGEIIAGHGRLLAAQELELREVPVVVLDHLTADQRRAYVIADNQLALNAGWDEELLSAELTDLDGLGFDLSLVGFSEAELGSLMGGEDPLGDDDGSAGDQADAPESSSLADRFGIPPFSVLNAREGWWQERKRGWLALGIKSELGRGGGYDMGHITGQSADKASPGGSMMPAADYGRSKARGDGRGRAVV